ncbi:YesL family protein [Neobacillus muris]|uniref:YesL family protein n=1 Tax=Neobacillus muris TaxID=2941334 RepID=UPI00203B360C|nr:YesL family protein [Neobacillus muris]
MDRLGERLNELCMLVLKLFYIQILWLLFTLLGFILLGAGPSTYAMFTVMRQWIRGNTDLPIFKTFLQAYKMGFKESAGFGILYLAAGTIIYVDLLYVHSQLLRGLLIIIGFIYLISLTYIFPILVHYDWKGIMLKMKCSVLFGISHLQYTLILFVALAAVYFVLLRYPGTLAFFGVSAGSYMIMWMTNQVFKRIELHAAAIDAKDEEQAIKGGGGA